MATNAERQARYRERQRSAGMRGFLVSATPEQAERIRAFLRGGVLPVTSNGAVTYHAPASQPLRRKRRKLDPVQEKNREIFEAHRAEIRRRLASGKKPSAIAAWLNCLGFVGTGAMLNGFLVGCSRGVQVINYLKMRKGCNE